MSYKKRTQRAVQEMYELQKTDGYGSSYCLLCRIYGERYRCLGCINKSSFGGCFSSKTFELSSEKKDWAIRAEFWAEVIPVLKAIDKKYFTPRYCRSHPEEARKKFAFMIDIDQVIYDIHK